MNDYWRLFYNLVANKNIEFLSLDNH